MRIGIDARLYNETGVGRYIRNLIQSLVRIDKVNEYILFCQKDAIKDIKLSRNWKVININIPWHGISEQIFYPWLIRQNKIDVIHFPYFSLPILYRGKFIVTIHDLTIYDYPTGKASTKPKLIYYLKYLAYRLILKQSIKNASRIIVPSKTVANSLTKKLAVSPQKITVTYEGGLNGVFSPKKGKIDEPFFLYVGNVYPHKNADNLIKAIARINQQRKKILKLVIVGKEDFFQKRLKKQINELNLSEQIRFINKVDDTDLVKLYRQAICLVFPSISEGFGLPAVEAMQQGCIVACSDIAVFHEICGEIPFYFNPYDVEDIAKILNKIELLNSDKRNNLTEKGMLFSRKYSWNTLANNTLKLYYEVGE